MTTQRTHYKQFCRGFVEALGTLPTVKGSSIRTKQAGAIAELKSTLRLVRDYQERLNAEGQRTVQPRITDLENSLHELEERKTELSDLEWEKYPTMNRVEFKNEYRINAWQTNSLISPYMGTLDTYGTFLADGVGDNGQHYRFHFAAQNETWMLKRIEFSVMGNSWYKLNVGAVPFVDQLR